MVFRSSACRAVLAFATLGVSQAFAQEEGVVSEPADAAPQARSWAFVDETTVPRAGEAFVQARATYSHYSASPTRPFATNVASPGSMGELGAEAGVGGGVSLMASAVIAGHGTAEVMLTMAGVALVALAHVANMRHHH